MTIRILLADDHTDIRASLRVLIDRQAGMEVVAEAENGGAMLQLIGSFKPNVVVMDFNLPDLKSADTVRQLISRASEVKFLILSMYSNREFLDGMLKAGASGYLLKDQVFEELVRAIRTVADGHIYICLGIEDSAAQ